VTESVERPGPSPAAMDGPRAAAAMAVNKSWEVALDAAISQVMPAGVAPPDLVLLFASPAWGAAFPHLVQVARERTGAGLLLGCSASGVLAGPREVEDGPALSLMACWLPGAHLYPVRLHQEHIELLADPATWHDMHGIPPGEVTSWVVFAEPYRIDAQGLVRGLQDLYPGSAIIGGMASGMVVERTSCVFLDGQVYREGGVALGIGGPYALQPHVSQGCDPIGESWTITAVEGNTLLGISNRPALEVLQETLDSLPQERRERAQNNLVCGLANNEYLDRYGRGDFLIRGILGIDAQRGALVLGGRPRVGQTMQFHIREASSARTDLKAMVSQAAGDPGTAVAALLCTCEGRGEALFGSPHHDARMVQAALPEVPLVGAFCIGEIGPLGTRAELHGFTATLGVLRHLENGA